MVQRGTHPNSLANLRPAWKKGEQPARPNSGPVVVPALKRFADMTYAQLMAINIDSLTGGEAVALITILKATDPKYGDKMREVVIDRLDGSLPRAATAIAELKTREFTLRMGVSSGGS